MDSFHASLKRACSHLTHEQFVRTVMSVNFITHDMAVAPIYSMHELRADFQDEMRDYVYRNPPNLSI